MIDSENETGNITTYEDDENEEYGIEIKGKNVVKLNADKVFVKTPLLTSAQDLAGAINELFQGGSGETSADSDYEKWLALPEPADNQAVFLVRMVESLQYVITFPGYDVYAEIGYSIDWGDGITETFATSVTSPRHTYESAGEYVITLTNIYGGNLYPSAKSAWLIMAKYGSNIHPNKPQYSNVFASCTRLRYIRLPSDTSFYNNYFYDCNCLRKIEFNGAISTLYQYMFNGCCELDFTQIKFENIEAVPTYCFTECYQLKEISFPNCITVGNLAFKDCYGLTAAEFSADCTFGTNCFQNCYALYPKPDGSI